MQQQSNGVEQRQKVDYPWKSASPKSTAVDKEENKKVAEEDPLWNNVKNIKEKEPMIWEVYNNKVTEIQREKENDQETDEIKRKPYQRFYNDRAYIVLCWHKASVTLIHDLHIWVSKHCSVEDYMLATAKAEQLDLLLDGKPVMHREIQFEESDTFHTYFKVEVRRRPKDDSEPKTKYDNCCLLQCHEEEAGLKGKKRQWMVERKFLQGNLCSDDVFVIINPNEQAMYLWESQKRLDGRKESALQYIKQNQSPKGLQLKAVVMDDTKHKDHHAFHLFPNKGKVSKAKPDNTPITPFKKLYNLEKVNGKDCAVESTKDICMSTLSQDSIDLLETESHLYVWIGQGVSYQESCRALFVAETFLMEKYGQKVVTGKFHQQVNKPITLVSDENPCIHFNRALMR